MKEELDQIINSYMQEKNNITPYESQEELEMDIRAHKSFVFYNAGGNKALFAAISGILIGAGSIILVFYFEWGFLLSFASILLTATFVALLVLAIIYYGNYTVIKEDGIFTKFRSGKIRPIYWTDVTQTRNIVEKKDNTTEIFLNNSDFPKYSINFIYLDCKKFHPTPTNKEKIQNWISTLIPIYLSEVNKSEE